MCYWLPVLIFVEYGAKVLIGALWLETMLAWRSSASLTTNLCLNLSIAWILKPAVSWRRSLSSYFWHFWSLWLCVCLSWACTKELSLPASAQNQINLLFFLVNTVNLATRTLFSSNTLNSLIVCALWPNLFNSSKPLAFRAMHFVNLIV